MKKNNVVAIIPARGGSKGIPKKNIIEFCGKPLVAWSIEQAKASKYIKDVYVSSNNREILQISEDFGAKAIKRPHELASDTSTSEDALLHAIDSIEKFDDEKIDFIVFLQATSPVRAGDDIDSAIELFISRKADSLFSAAILEDFCVWEVRNDKLRSMTFDYRNRGRRQDRKPYYLENGSIYIFKPKVMRRYNNRLGGKIVFYPMPFWRSYEIDTIKDVDVCEYYMKNKILKSQK